MKHFLLLSSVLVTIIFFSCEEANKVEEISARIYLDGTWLWEDSSAAPRIVVINVLDDSTVNINYIDYKTVFKGKNAKSYYSPDITFFSFDINMQTKDYWTGNCIIKIQNIKKEYSIKGTRQE